MRARKPETEIRDLKRQLKEAEAARTNYHDEALRLRNRLIAAQRERDEWKARFDLLLTKLPPMEEER
jgi:hypothetical protein